MDHLQLTLPVRDETGNAPSPSRPIDESYLDEVRKDYAPARPSPVFATYWLFAARRHAVFLRRVAGHTPPWTTDPILARFKFTNAYRASDRVSQYLIRNVSYGHDWSAEDSFFRTFLFKVFNRPDTWELLRDLAGEPTWASFDLDRYDKALTQAMAEGKRIFSAAYIMPSGCRQFGGQRKHENYLRLLQAMMRDGVAGRLSEAPTLKAAFGILRSYPLLGDFLAYQLSIDLNYGTLLSFDEDDFVVAGPGARDGIVKCFESTGGLTDAEVVGLMAERQDREFARLGLPFAGLWGRRLKLIDCQNLFCEVDKYARVAHPEIVGRSGRARIKQTFQPKPSLPEYWYPPKWGINEAAGTAQRRPLDARRDGQG